MLLHDRVVVVHVMSALLLTIMQYDPYPRHFVNRDDERVIVASKFQNQHEHQLLCLMVNVQFRPRLAVMKSLPSRITHHASRITPRGQTFLPCELCMYVLVCIH